MTALGTSCKFVTFHLGEFRRCCLDITTVRDYQTFSPFPSAVQEGQPYLSGPFPLLTWERLFIRIDLWTRNAGLHEKAGETVPTLVEERS